jgi:hypothetical protein
LGISVVILPLATSEPAHSNVCGPFPSNGWTPVILIKKVSFLGIIFICQITAVSFVTTVSDYGSFIFVQAVASYTVGITGTFSGAKAAGD